MLSSQGTTSMSPPVSLPCTMHHSMFADPLITNRATIICFAPQFSHPAPDYVALLSIHYWQPHLPPTSTTTPA